MKFDRPACAFSQSRAGHAFAQPALLDKRLFQLAQLLVKRKKIAPGLVSSGASEQLPTVYCPDNR